MIEQPSAAPLRYDLHMHTTASDGTLSPQALVDRANERGLGLIAITDHDTMDGVIQLRNQGELGDLQLVSGVELTAQLDGRILHIVGLNLDENNQGLAAYFEELQQLRQRRLEAICTRLSRTGVNGQAVQTKAFELANGASPGRPHIARAMVALNIVKSEQAAFNQYLGTGKVADVKMSWPSLEQAIEVIKAAGGVAVLAHPTKYKMTMTKVRRVVDEFIELGGEGIEVSYTGIGPDHMFYLIRLAKEKGLFISAGSDFHSPSHGWTDIGKFPAIEVGESHILNRLI